MDAAGVLGVRGGCVLLPFCYSLKKVFKFAHPFVGHIFDPDII